MPPTSGRLIFKGSVLGFFFRYLLLILTFVVVIPYPWYAVVFTAWLVSMIDIPGKRVEFFGTWKEKWWLFGLLAFCSFVPNILNWIIEPSDTGTGTSTGTLIIAACSILANLAAMIIAYFILEWFIARIRLDKDETFTFNGSLCGFFRRNIVLGLSALTIVGWPWVFTWFMRWVCAGIEGRQTAFTFEGSGLALLGRVAVPFGLIILVVIAMGLMPESMAEPNNLTPLFTGLGIFGLLCLIALPWYIMWLVRWFIASIAVNPAQKN